MSFQKMIDDLKNHFDERFDALEEKLAEPVEQTTQPTPQIEGQSILDLGLPSQQETALLQAGYRTVESLAAATDDELRAVDGVGKRTVEFIRGRTG